MQYSQKYSIVHFIQPVPVNYEYTMNDWPLHITLADVFSIDLNDEVIKKIVSFASAEKVLQALATQDSELGSKESPTSVTLIEKSPELQSLHDKLIELLGGYGAVFNSPQFTHKGYLPHCTIQRHSRINASDDLIIDDLSIIDMFVKSDWKRRKVISTVKLSH
jgi:hypothetical protein